MLISNWLKNLPRQRVRCSRRKGWQRVSAGPADLARRVDRLEDRTLLASDFGDAPDTGAGTGTGNYETLLANGGPSHVIDATQLTLFLGARVDAEANASPNSRANGDDITTLPDDEDGLIEPARDLVLTVGAAPVVRVRATNSTGSTAMLYGWIDYNQDGEFDNATEQASVSVPSGSNNATFKLTFPTIPANTTPGTTYARFRLSTDAAAGNSTGEATGGEVEDYAATITSPSAGTADSASTKKLASSTNGLPPIFGFTNFGSSVASLGDLDGDGVSDLAVGAEHDSTGGTYRGAVHVLLMNSNGSVKTSVKIASSTNGGPPLQNGNFFGSSVASLGDLDGDGITDLAVGADGDDGDYSTSRGAVDVLFLNSNGSVKNSKRIGSAVNGGPTLTTRDHFGSALASLGDLDGDGVTDLAVGADGDLALGSIYVLLMNSNGSVKNSVIIASDKNGGPTLATSDRFGSSVASLSDLDGDGLADLAVGASGDDTGGTDRGAVHLLFLNSAGTVKSSLKLASGLSGVPTLANGDNFGSSVATVGDVDGDGVTDLVVGAEGDDTNGTNRGAVYVLLMNSTGTVKSSLRIASGTYGGPTLANGDNFGSAVASLGDLDGDGLADLAVGASNDVYGGAVHVLFLNAATPKQPELVSLPAGGGNYEVLRDASALVVRVAGGSELLRMSAAQITSLTITGSSDADIVTVLNSGSAVDSPIIFNGDAGNDVFDGSLSAGAITVDGGAGNDTLRSGAASDQLNGGDGDDVLSGGLGNDVLDGGGGAFDLLHDGGDADIVLTNSTLTGIGNDVLIGIERAFIFGGPSPNRIDASSFSGSGFTILDGAGGGDTLFGTAGPDILTSTADGDDSMFGNAGDDFVFAGSGRDTLIGGSGNDVLFGQGGSGDVLHGDDGNDRLDGGTGNDPDLDGGNGNDRIFGGTGDDQIYGRAGKDSLFGGDGNDQLFGHSGGDFLSGGAGTDLIDGGGATDRFSETADADFTVIGLNVQSAATGNETLVGIEVIFLIGGPGNNRLDATQATIPVLLIGLDGNDTLGGGLANDILDGGNGDDIINGGQGDDVLVGGNGNDGLSGYRGDDTLFGGAGNDLLVGHDGSDSILGEAGQDTLVGGGGTSVDGDRQDVLIGGDDPDQLDGDQSEFTAELGDTVAAFTVFPAWVDAI